MSFVFRGFGFMGWIVVNLVREIIRLNIFGI